MTRIDEQSRYDVEEAIASRAGHGPVLRRFPRRQYFFDDHVERCTRHLLKALEIGGWIKKAVWVIHPDARNLPLGNEPLQQDMCRIEDRRFLHTESDELVDVEESPVIDFVRGRTPVREAIRLALEQFVQHVIAGRAADNAIDDGNVFYGSGHDRTLHGWLRIAPCP